MTAETAQVQTIVTNVAHHIDRKRWAALEALYAQEVETDYSSLFGGAPQRSSAQALVAGWRANLADVVTQHLLGPIEVDLHEQRATARCHVRAFHYSATAASGSTWEVLGHHVFELARDAGDWRIARMTLEMFHQLGNPRLLHGG